MVEILTQNLGVRVCCSNKLSVLVLRRNSCFSSFGLFCLLLASTVFIVAGDVSRDELNDELGADDSKPQVRAECTIKSPIIFSESKLRVCALGK
jgi:hypothetical protein